MRIYLEDPKRKKPELIVVPTAGGKSLLAAEAVKTAKGNVVVLQPSQELLVQNLEKFEQHGEFASVYCAGLGRKELDRRVIYATLDSIKSVQHLISVDVLIIDEAHYKFSPDPGSVFSKFVEVVKPKKIIGMTATPFRLVAGMDVAGQPVSELKLLTRMRPNYFKDYIDIVQIQEVIENGFWSDLNYEICAFDNSALVLNSTGSEFTEESIKRVIKEQKINNKIYLRIKQLLAEGCPSILVFCDEVANAEKFATLFKDSTVLSANTKKKERDLIVANFKAGIIKVVFNVGILTTGFDYPDLRCVIMGRPTNSMALYYQIVGRLTRISKLSGKKFGLFIDYGGNVDRFGRVEDLVMENIEGWGWGFCSGDYVLTNQPMGGMKVTKQQLTARANKKKKGIEEDKIWFGKFEGTVIEDLPMWYVEFMLYKSNLDFSSPKMNVLYKRFLAMVQQTQGLVIEKPAENVF